MRFAASTNPQISNGAVVATITGNVGLLNAGTGANANNALNDVLGSLGQARAFAATTAGTAGAGNKAIVELQNPGASGKNVYLYALDFFVPVAMAINMFLDGTTITPASFGVNRQTGGAAGVGKYGGSNQLAPTGTLIYTSPTLTANVQYQIPQPWIVQVTQGHNLQLQGQTVNQAFTANLYWIELN